MATLEDTTLSNLDIVHLQQAELRNEVAALRKEFEDLKAWVIDHRPVVIVEQPRPSYGGYGPPPMVGGYYGRGY
jgi:hypothetical protein